jgi:hypothetical protein
MVIQTLYLRVFETDEALRLLTTVAGVAGADRKVDMAAAYETPQGSTLSLTFAGAPQEAQVVKEFLSPQFRAASEKDLRTEYTLTFPAGLAPDGEEPGRLTERLARLATGPVLARALLIRGVRQ